VRYAFADSDVAARRLGLVADVFAGSTAAFLASAVRQAPALALDLGCGPGHTTYVLATVTGARRTVGLDISEAFIAAASRTATATVSFRRHNVTRLPFPVGLAELAYCRFLLTHLPDPVAVLTAWATALAPSGLLVVEEVEWIETTSPTFREYLAIVEALLARSGGALYVGERLDRLAGAGALLRRSSTVTRLPVADRHAAAMFALNLAAWGGESDLRARHGEESLARLGALLRATAERADDDSTITWGLRQMVFERT
jgi:SAM-dependent methyltransferase